MTIKSNLAFRFALAFTLAVLLAWAGEAPAKSLTGQTYHGKHKAKYVFLFIGDGMGIPQRAATEQFLKRKLKMNEMPAHGVTTTHANNRFITGSAASATALASGMKTNINYIGVDPEFKPIKTLAELAREKGMKVGIVSSVSIDHATPAAFYAHVKTRKMYHEIDHALAGSGFDFFGGGGLVDPKGKKSKSPMGDAVAKAKENGYKVVADKDSFMALKPSDGKVLAVNPNLPDGQALPYTIDQTASDITLPEFTAKAVEMLDNDKGFFLMVEGGKIDWACHANDAVSAMTNNIAFDESILVALEFYEAHPDDTLIVVTGDHECGGLTLGFAGTEYETYDDVLGEQKISFQKFTDDTMKLWKQECAKTKGGCSFKDIQPTITHYFGLKFSGDPATDRMVLEEYEVRELSDAYTRSMAGDLVKFEGKDEYIRYGASDGYDPLAVAVTHVLNHKAGLGWTSYKHTGVPVSTSAIGVGADTFNGYYDNTDVAKKIMAVMGVKPEAHYLGETDSRIKVAAN